MSALDFVYMNLAYLIQSPVYQCKFAGSEEWSECTEEDICGSMIGQPDVEWKIDWDHENSIHNWRERLDLMCASDFRINLLLSAWFLGISATVLWVPRLSDKRSRKFFQGSAVVIDLLMYTILLFTKSYGLMVLVLFCMGCTGPQRVQIGWVYLLELASTEY